jgi:hypothetical protein
LILVLYWLLGAAACFSIARNYATHATPVDLDFVVHTPANAADADPKKEPLVILHGLLYVPA